MGVDSIDAAFNETQPVEVVPEVIAAEPVETPEVIEPVVEIVIEEPKEARTVPLPTFLDQRDELKEAKRRIAEFEQSKPSEPAAIPDPYDDPDGYHAYTQTQRHQDMVSLRFEMSEMFAKQAHGEEAVDAAASWAEGKAKADPSFAAAYMREKNPIDWIVRQHKRDGLVSQLPDDVASLDELIEREIAKRGLSAPVAAIPVAAVSQPALTPRRSLASETSRQGSVTDTPSGPMAGLRAVFG